MREAEDERRDDVKGKEWKEEKEREGQRLRDSEWQDGEEDIKEKKTEKAKEEYQKGRCLACHVDWIVLAWPSFKYSFKENV